MRSLTLDIVADSVGKLNIARCTDFINGNYAITGVLKFLKLFRGGLCKPRIICILVCTAAPIALFAFVFFARKYNHGKDGYGNDNGEFFHVTKIMNG
jgi:hypothetical protein